MRLLSVFAVQKVVVSWCSRKKLHPFSKKIDSLSPSFFQRSLLKVRVLLKGSVWEGIVIFILDWFFTEIQIGSCSPWPTLLYALSNSSPFSPFSVTAHVKIVTWGRPPRSCPLRIVFPWKLQSRPLDFEVCILQRYVGSCSPWSTLLVPGPIHLLFRHLMSGVTSSKSHESVLLLAAVHYASLSHES